MMTQEGILVKDTLERDGFTSAILSRVYNGRFVDPALDVPDWEAKQAYTGTE